MEEELLHLKKEEAENSRVLMELGSQRDRMTLAIAQKLAKVRCACACLECWHYKHLHAADRFFATLFVCNISPQLCLHLFHHRCPAASVAQPSASSLLP